ncbi:MAG TPA: DUF3093 domain-containing protein [Streptosporangiaceae bacterium]|jgi:hypothetical protein
MRNYRERLRVPVSYWVLGLFTMACFATIVWAGFSMAIGYVVYAVLLGGPALALLAWGRFTVGVGGGELRAGRAVLPLARAGKVQALDESQTTRLRGPLADPAALMLTRPYLKRAVYVEVTGDSPVPPYWLVGTRDPDALATAIELSRPPALAGEASMA